MNIKKALYVTMAGVSAAGALGATNIMADEVVYEVPVKMQHAHENKPSMGNKALTQVATVVEKDGKTEITIEVKGLKFMGLYGHLWGMEAYDGGFDSGKKPVVIAETKEDESLEPGKKMAFPSKLTIVRDKNKEKEVRVAIQVDAMDAIQSGGAASYDKIKKGTGSQNAILVLDYSNAKVVSEEKPEVKPVISKVKVDRISGNSRFATAAKISQSAYDKADTVIIANGMDKKEADALAAAPMAALKNAPILLVQKDVLPGETLNEIKRLGAKNAVIIGGEGSVSSKVESALKSNNIASKRISGKDRIDTSLKIAEEVRSLSSNKAEAILVDGYNFADALSVSSLATKKGIPVLLTGSANLDKATSNSITAWKLNKVTVVGGVNSVSENAKNAVAAKEKVRISGSSRYDTALAVAKVADPQAKSVIIANGRKAADALAAGAVTAKLNSPILLTEQANLPGSIKSFITSNKVNSVKVVGGANSVSENIINNLK